MREIEIPQLVPIIDEYPTTITITITITLTVPRWKYAILFQNMSLFFSITHEIASPTAYRCNNHYHCLALAVYLSDFTSLETSS
jgi:hypothetical protein